MAHPWYRAQWIQLAGHACFHDDLNDAHARGDLSVDAPGGLWTIDNGTYTITMQSNQVSDTGDVFVAEGTLGTFVMRSARYDSADSHVERACAGEWDGVDEFHGELLDKSESESFVDRSADIQITGPNSLRRRRRVGGRQLEIDDRSRLIDQCAGRAWDALWIRDVYDFDAGRQANIDWESSSDVAMSNHIRTCSHRNRKRSESSASHAPPGALIR